jgi:hypothetical protein
MFALIASMGSVVTVATGCKSSSSGSNNNNLNNNQVECGNDAVETGEECDGSDLAGEDCASLGLVGGSLDCAADCSFDVSACTGSATCGNDTREFPEACDGSDLADSSCEDLGFVGGTLACDGSCEFDTAACDVDDCGNDLVDAGEQCDGADLDGQSCTGLGFSGGALDCDATCSFNTSGCTGAPTCGDNIQVSPEDCDGTDLGGQDCASQGFDDGALACLGDCTFDTGACYDYVCGDGTVDPGETCDPPGSCPTDCDDANVCTNDLMLGAPATCDVVCQNDLITVCQNGDGCCPTGCDSATDDDCGTPLMPRLFVAHAGGAVQFWNLVDSISTDVPADGTLGGPAASGLAMTLHGDRLFVATNSTTDPLYIYDGASQLGDGGAPSDTVGVAAFGGSALFVVYAMFVDANDDLWVDNGNIRLFLDAPALGGGSSSQAQFTHMWGPQIYGAASDTIGNKLIGGQVSGAGLIVWDNPTADTGETNDEDWTLWGGPTNPYCMLIEGDRLYAGNVNLGVDVFDNISGIAAITTPSFSLTTDLTDVFKLHVRDDVLVVVVNDAPSGYQINIYLNASTITGDVAPDFIIQHANITLPESVWLDQNYTLYVTDQNGILIFDTATTAPTFRTELTTGFSNTRDIRVIECGPAHPCGGGLTCQHGRCVP